MPELPEVEVITRGLRPHLTGRIIEDIWYSGKALRNPVDFEAMQENLLGRRITTISRRAKYIQIETVGGALLIIHLGMTGNMGIFPINSPRKKHDHLEWQLDNKTLLRLHDTRRFGAVHTTNATEAAATITHIFRTTGPEPFDDSFTADYLKNLAANRSIPVKQFIMTNQVVAGVGNIYANESLFLAGIRPSTKASRISIKRWTLLVEIIKEVLNHAIECGGSTISDFVNVGQQTGYFQMNFRVYGKDGQACRNCRSIVKKQVLGGRASYYCPKCQK
jgi:formamidopyrimidine-DNA glycosylase